MTDTARTISYLQTQEFDDAQPNDGITPQYMRDVLVTIAARTPIFLVDQPEYAGSISAAIAGAVAAGGGIVLLGAHDYTLGSGGGLTFDPSVVNLWGMGAKSRLLCQSLGSGNPVITLTGGIEGTTAIRGIQFCAFNAGQSKAPVNTAGVGHTDYVSGSQAINFNAVVGATIRDCQFYNFDSVTAYNAAGNTWGLGFDNCIFGACNKGYSIASYVTNSFERMWARECIFAACNYGAYIDFAASGGAGAFRFDNCAFDYNAIRHIWYRGSETNTRNGKLVASGGWMETTDTCSGTTVCRIFCEGEISLADVLLYENGNAPIGYVELSSTSYSRGKATNCFSVNGNQIPLFYSTNSQIEAAGYGNAWQQPNEILLARCANGDIAGESDVADRTLFVTGFDPHSDLEAQQRLHMLESGVTGAGSSGSPYIWTIDPDSSTKHVIGTRIYLYNASTNYWTVTPGAGVSVTADSGTTTFNAYGTHVMLLKTAANTWRMHYL